MSTVIDFVLQAKDNASQAFDGLRARATRAVDAVKSKVDELRYAPNFYGTFLNIPIPRALGEHLESLRTRFAVFRQSASSAWAAVSGAAAIAGVSIGLTAAGVVTALIRMNTEYQRMQTQLRTFEGSQGAANAVMQDLKRLAVELPFDLKNITQAYIELRAIGLQPTEKMIRDFADIAAAMGTDIVNVAHGIRRGVAGEFDPLETAVGATFRVVGDKIRATFRGISTDISRDANSITAYLQKLAQTNFAGAANQTNTLGMAFSNLGDAVYNAATTLGEAGFSQTVIDITKRVSDLTNAIGKNEVGIRESYGRVVALAVAAYQTLVFIPKLAVEGARGIAAAIAVVIGTFAVGIEQIVLAAVEVYRKADEWMFQRTNDTARRIEASLKGAIAAGKAGTQSVMAEADRAQADVIATTSTAMASWEAVATSFSDANHAAIVSSVALSTAEAKQFREARDHAQQLQVLEAQVRAGKKLTADQAKEHSALKQKLATEENALVEEYNALLAKGDAASLDRRAMLMNMIVQIEQARNGTLGVTPAAPPKVKAGADPHMERIQELTKLIPIERERAVVLKGLHEEEALAHKALEQGNLKLEDRAKVYARLNAIASAFEQMFKAQVDALALLARQAGGAADAVRVLEFMERGLKTQVDDTTRSVNDRTAALHRLKTVEAELAQAREAAERQRVERSIYGTPEERQDARDHDPTRAPQVPIDKVKTLPGTEQRAKDYGVVPELEMTKIIANEVAEVLGKIGGKETVWTRMATGIRRGRTEAEMLKDTIDEIANISMAGLGDAMMAAGEAIGSGSGNAAAALAGSMLGAISQVAQALGRMFMAQAIASYASVTAPPPIGPNPGGAAAGAGYMAAAAAAYAVAGLVSGAASSVSGGRGGGGAGGGVSGFREVGEELRRAKQTEKVIVLEGDYFDLKDPKSLDRLAHQLGEAFDARLSVRGRRGTRRVRA